jgi:mono/diheme cytochrome c family protein
MDRLLPTAALGLSMFAAAAAAQQPDDIAAGRDLALNVCTFCHVVAPDQPTAPILRPAAPTFRSIANRSTTTAASLSTFLHTPHRDVPMPAAMPNLELSDEQIGTLVRFMLSLRGQQ